MHDAFQSFASQAKRHAQLGVWRGFHSTNVDTLLEMETPSNQVLQAVAEKWGPCKLGSTLKQVEDGRSKAYLLRSLESQHEILTEQKAILLAAREATWRAPVSADISSSHEATQLHCHHNELWIEERSASHKSDHGHTESLLEQVSAFQRYLP